MAEECNVRRLKFALDTLRNFALTGF